MKTKPGRKWTKGLKKWLGACAILGGLFASVPAEAKEVGLDLPSVAGAARRPAGDQKHPALGVLNAVFGTINNGLIIWTPEEQEPSGRRLYIKPLILTDASGQLTPGVGLKLVNW